jgi:hypothetical protein
MPYRGGLYDQKAQNRCAKTRRRASITPVADPKRDAGRPFDAQKNGLAIEQSRMSLKTRVENS